MYYKIHDALLKIQALTSNEKLILIIIDSFKKYEKECIADSRWLSNKLGITEFEAEIALKRLDSLKILNIYGKKKTVIIDIESGVGLDDDYLMTLDVSKEWSQVILELVELGFEVLTYTHEEVVIKFLDLPEGFIKVQRKDIENFKLAREVGFKPDEKAKEK